MRKSKVEDRGVNDWNSDPLDLGSDEVEVEHISTRGRPRSPIVDRTRAAYWAWTVQRAAGKSFAELEREMALRQFPKRDGGGFEQPNAWLKYAKGERSPLPPSKGDKSPVLRAEVLYPGTRATYDSILWDMMYDDQSQPTRRMKLTSRIAPYVLTRIDSVHIEKQDQYRVLLTPDGISRLVLIRHLDALGLLLMQWRNLDWERADVYLIHMVRMWLLFSFQWMEPFVTCRSLLKKLIHHNVGELGLLNGPGGLDPNKTHEERVIDTYWACFTGGVAVPIFDFPNSE